MSHENLFETKSDVETSRVAKIGRYIDIWVYAPAKIILSDWRGVVGIGIILTYIFMGTIGVVLIPKPTGSGPRFASIFVNWDYPLGTDNFGNGLLRMTIHATPAILKMISAGAIFSTAVATIVGTFAGFKGGSIDRILMTISDIALTIPGLPLVIVLAAILQPENPFVVGFILTINAWAGLARTIRSQILPLREEAYVEASRIVGVPSHQIILHDIMPNITPYIFINMMNSARSIIFSAVGLYFLGFLPFSHANWGVMLNLAWSAGALYNETMTHWLLVPLITISVFSYGLILLSQSFDRVFNVRVRSKHAKTVSSDETGME